MTTTASRRNDMREALMLGVKTYDLDYVAACQ
jgi:hypothetical protein